MKEIEIEADQVNTFKVKYHRSFLENWLNSERINLSLSELWGIREACIFNIEQKK